MRGRPTLKMGTPAQGPIKQQREKSMRNRCGIGEKPRDDNDYFEQMSKAVFRSGFHWAVIEKKWPDFQTAFQNFEIEKVARFGEPEIDQLMKNTGVVRNYRKITAVHQNAHVFLEIRKSHGSFSDSLKTNHDNETSRHIKYLISEKIRCIFTHYEHKAATE